MKKTTLILALFTSNVAFTNATVNTLISNSISKNCLMDKLEIKIKNDLDDEIRVSHEKSGGSSSYTLTKGAVTTIKMEAGDKLFMYEGGKKGKLLLTAEGSMDGKVQLLSKL